jgi:hypothetical protein
VSSRAFQEDIVLRRLQAVLLPKVEAMASAYLAIPFASWPGGHFIVLRSRNALSGV